MVVVLRQCQPRKPDKFGLKKQAGQSIFRVLSVFNRYHYSNVQLQSYRSNYASNTRVWRRTFLRRPFLFFYCYPNVDRRYKKGCQSWEKINSSFHTLMNCIHQEFSRRLESRNQSPIFIMTIRDSIIIKPSSQYPLLCMMRLFLSGASGLHPAMSAHLCNKNTIFLVANGKVTSRAISSST